MTLWTHERLRPKNWRSERTKYKQYKYNGHRFTVYKQRYGKLVGFERKIRDDLEITVKRPKIIEYDWWKGLERIPPMSSVDGELYVLNGNAGDAAHAIAECLSILEFMPFAVPWWRNVNLSTVGLEYAQRLLVTHSNGDIGLKLAPFFSLYDHETYESLCDDATDLDIEGWVLKNHNYEEWWKVKPIQEIDVIVTGLKWSESDRYIGTIASVIVSIYVDDKLIEIANVPGSSFDDKTRWEIDEKDIGRVMQIQYQELGNGKRLIHSRFDGWRDDKPTEQCTYEWEDL